MGEFSIYHWLIVVFIIVFLFGARKIPELMKGLGEGMRSFKEGMAGKPPTSTPPAQITDRAGPTTGNPPEKS